MDASTNREELVKRLTGCQGWLYGQILCQLPDPHEAKDVFQQTNLPIWRKADEFDPSANFHGWASRFARFQVLAHLRDSQRVRYRFNDVLLDQLAGQSQSNDLEASGREIALHRCLEKLKPAERELIVRRYSEGESVTRIAAARQKSVNAISRSLYRIRNLLADCIEREEIASEAP